MKSAKVLLLVAALCVALVPSMAKAAPWSQAWVENGVGLFDAIGMTRVSGGAFASPTLTLDSGATNWVETDNANNAFASFDLTSVVYFTTHLLGAPGEFILYAYRGNNLVDTARVDTNLNITSPYVVGAPTRDEQFAASRPFGTVAEPGILLLVALGFLAFTTIAKRRAFVRHSAAALT